jgi:cytochrome c553
VNVVVLLMSAFLAADEPSAARTPSAQQLRFFEMNVRPLLVEHCFKCHGEKKQWGGLRLDSRESMLRGGDSGAAVTVGSPEKSLLIERLRETDKDLRMPKGGRLTDRQIATLVRWMEMGAPFPSSPKTKRPLRDPNHWSFKPPVEPPVPAVSKPDWPESEIDNFVLARLDEAGLSPAPQADRRTLIRRVTFDLTGLPPTPEEVDAFLADESSDLFARVVDRLLASPRYGERWGRHWLDVARYADSNGFDENVCHGNAWRYRDYVVSAFNRDKPFDRFVIEQLSGDLLAFENEAQQHEQLIATGFLSIGPKVLAETDEPKMRMDIIDEQLDTTGRAFLGLTFGCARCHDHKFDPITAEDYYALAGIFKSTLTMRKYQKVAEWHEHLLPSAAATAIQKAFDAKMDAGKKAIADFIAEADGKVRAIQPGKQPSGEEARPENLESQYPAETKAELKKLRDDLAALQKEGPNLPAAMGVTEDKVVDIAVHLRGDPLTLGDIVPRRTPLVLTGPPLPRISDKESGRRQLAEWLADPQNPLTARVIVNRIWRWHFGQGLVRSTDNFGLLGEAPSHPKLLDWLARRFVSDGWSMKSLHRRILLSSVWQQSAATSPKGLRIDPENRLFSRAPIRRLEAEAVRDSLLAVSGQLDETMGGSLLTLKNRAYFFDHTSIDKTTYDSHRRSLYLPVVRNNVYDVFQLLDFPDPAVSNGNRSTTVVASQALLMLNSDLVMESASELARRLLAEAGSDAERLARLYLLAFGRGPTERERAADRTFLVKLTQPGEQNAKSRQEAWAALCHVTLAANEFIYLR